MDKRELLKDLFAGRISVDEFNARAARLNGAIIGIIRGDLVEWDDTMDGRKRTGTEAEFQRAGKNRFAILIRIVS